MEENVVKIVKVLFIYVLTISAIQLFLCIFMYDYYVKMGETTIAYVYYDVSIGIFVIMITTLIALITQYVRIKRS